MRWPRIELGSTAWKAAMLTIIPPTLIKQMFSTKKQISKLLMVFSFYSVLMVVRGGEGGGGGTFKSLCKIEKQ